MYWIIIVLLFVIFFPIVEFVSLIIDLIKIAADQPLLFEALQVVGVALLILAIGCLCSFYKPKNKKRLNEGGNR